MTFGNPHNKFRRDYPLGEYVHKDIPNYYDPTKVKLPSGRDFACAISESSLDYRTWYIHKDDYLDLMRILDSGVANRNNYWRMKYEDSSR